eukprot:TRINITY_DN34172_c0_g1_i1.p1 TRINITY_DN34172_c0_g1~~TRINITY_DN34172_c0_g1_i1.p1  ORF type:complete len:179 (+),score=18.50 TRINITY_DN34172_c0_g1_i1:356-892(+)
MMMSMKHVTAAGDIANFLMISQTTFDIAASAQGASGSFRGSDRNTRFYTKVVSGGIFRIYLNVSVMQHLYPELYTNGGLASMIFAVASGVYSIISPSKGVLDYLVIWWKFWVQNNWKYWNGTRLTFWKDWVRDFGVPLAAFVSVIGILLVCAARFIGVFACTESHTFQMSSFSCLTSK